MPLGCGWSRARWASEFVRPHEPQLRGRYGGGCHRSRRARRDEPQHDVLVRAPDDPVVINSVEYDLSHMAHELKATTVAHDDDWVRGPLDHPEAQCVRRGVGHGAWNDPD